MAKLDWDTAKYAWEDLEGLLIHSIVDLRCDDLDTRVPSADFVNALRKADGQSHSARACARCSSRHSPHAWDDAPTHLVTGPDTLHAG